jgi:AbrB family looped-hinge helix DNA binding protein
MSKCSELGHSRKSKAYFIGMLPQNDMGHRLWHDRHHGTCVAIIARLPWNGYDCQKCLLKGAPVRVQVNITATGRMSLPIEVRKKLGLSEGGQVFLEETEDGVVLRTAAQAVARAQAIARQFTSNQPRSSTDAFLSSRRAESGE